MSDIITLAEGLGELHSMWTPLPWQVPFGRALFYEGIKDLGAECGRSSGKTELAGYCSWRYAFENPGSENYIIEPLFKQAKEILWASDRIQSFGPKEWIQSVNNTELRIVFNNGSFIKLEGSDDTESLRGIKPRGLIVWDETKDCKKAAIEAMDPNRARYNAPQMMIGTPPEFHNHFVDYMNGFQKNPKAFHTRATSFDNPYNDVNWLLRKKKELYDRGESETWLREYEAIFVLGGKNAVFPGAAKLKPKPINELWPKDINHWHCYVLFDPGSSTTFAVKFNLFNPYLRKVIWLDEIYLQNMKTMNTDYIWNEVEPKLQEISAKGCQAFEFIYDEAAAWFRNESYVHPIGSKYPLFPTQKASHPKDYGLSTIRMMMDQGLIEVSDRCVKTMWEMQNYIKDEKGKIPKENDHLNDLERYFVAAVGLDLNENDVPKSANKDLEPRFKRLEDELNLDPLRSFDDELYSSSNDTFFEEI